MSSLTSTFSISILSTLALGCGPGVIGGLPVDDTSDIAETTGGSVDSDPDRPTLEPRALVHFESCDQMIGYAKDHAAELIEAGFFPFADDFYLTDDVAIEEVAVADDDSSPTPSSPEYSETNNQEAGVDEPDLVKTDGTRMLSMMDSVLRYTDVGEGEPQMRGSLQIPDSWGAQILSISKNRAFLVSPSWSESVIAQSKDSAALPDLWKDSYASLTSIIEVDISDPDNLEVVGQLHLAGDYKGARVVNGQARVVVRSAPVGLNFKSWWELDDGDEDKAKDEAQKHNLKAIADSGAENWLPSYLSVSAKGEDSGLAVECKSAMMPGVGSGLGMLSVVTVDLGDNIQIESSTGVFADGDTVYSSQENLYVATSPWFNMWFGGDIAVGLPEFAGRAGDVAVNEVKEPEPEPETTFIHAFAFAKAGDVRYAASGEVPGHLNSQWSMSEHAGDLRIASTSWGTEDVEQQSHVTVLRQDSEDLEKIGGVSGLGPDERIYAVRFMGDMGYVVTFRETDPLYVVNLADPTAPKVEGELKINGYSAYLHPVGPGLLLGVGQDATDDGSTLGTQLSLFDVSNPKDPKRLHQYTIEGGYSEAEFDHHAFLYWQQTQTAVIPLSRWSDDNPFYGAIAVSVDKDTGFEVVGAVEHPVEYASPTRSVVVGDLLYTLSYYGLLASDMNGYDDVGWMEFEVQNYDEWD